MTLTIQQIEKVEQMLVYATDIYSDCNGADHFYSDPDTDLQCGIYIDDEKRIVVASFRGTTSKEDKMTDLEIQKTKYFGKIRVHTGFYNQLFKSCVYQQFLDEFISIVGSTNYDVYVTGHSLGAALASLFTFRLSCSLDRCINNITFASPKVGNYYWKKAFDTNINIKNLRVMVSSDPIPLTPFINYYHVNGVLCLNSGKILWYIDDHSTSMYNKLIKQKKLDIEYRNRPSVALPKKCNKCNKDYKCGRSNIMLCSCVDVYDPSPMK